MRTVRQLGEVGLIGRLRQRLRRPASVVVGIGDDAAVVRLDRGQWWLLASDMLVEGVHFRLPAPRARQAGRLGVVPAQWIGWKALACNVSDIAAMGGVPRWAVISLGLPPTTPVAWVDRVYAGLERCARRFGVAIVGGDTVRAPRLIIDVAIVGSAHPARLVRRSGARVGDHLFVTGRLGGSYRSGRHARFIPRLREAHALLRRVQVHAMMDLSDGLACDAWQMSRASGVTLRIQAARVPRAPAARTLTHALTDGEDFELLFAVPPEAVPRLPARLGRTPVTRIGAVVARGVGVELESPDGRIEPLAPIGFRHF